MCHLAYLRLTDEDPPPECPELLLPEKELLRPIELLLLTEEDLLTDELLLLLKFAEEYPIDRQIDGVVFGHIHHAGFRTADNGREVWFLGEWTGTPVYGVMDDKDNFSLKPYGKK